MAEQAVVTSETISYRIAFGESAVFFFFERDGESVGVSMDRERVNELIAALAEARDRAFPM